METTEFKVEINGTEKKLVFKKPTDQDVRKAQMESNKYIAELIKNSGSKGPVLSRDNLVQFMKENKMWTDEDDNKVRQLHEDVLECLKKIKRGGISKSEARRLGIQANEKRNQAMALTMKRSKYDDMTIEAQGERVVLDYLIYLCTIDPEKSSQYWDSFSQLKMNAVGPVYDAAFSALLKIQYGVDSNLDDSLPEIKLLKHLGFVNDKFQFIDPVTGKRVDRDGNDLKEEEPVDLGDITQPDVPFTD